MSSLQPHPLYSAQDLRRLYPPNVKLQLAMIVRWSWKLHVSSRTLSSRTDLMKFFRHGSGSRRRVFLLITLIYYRRKNARTCTLSKCRPKPITRYIQDELTRLRQVFLLVCPNPGYFLKCCLAVLTRGSQTQSVWPLCSTASYLVNSVKNSGDPAGWTSLEWQRRLEKLENGNTSLSTW